MSEEFTYEGYIKFLTNQAREQSLEPLSAGILRSHGHVLELQAENARFREALEKIEWLAGECDDDFEALWGAAHVTAEQALR